MTTIGQYRQHPSRRDWKWARLGSACDLRTGGTPNRSEPKNFGGEIKWLVSGDVHQGEIFDCAGRITDTGMVNSNAQPLPPGCVLIALNGQGKTRGTVALLQVEATCNQSLVAMIPKNPDELLPRFLLFQLQMRYQELRDLTGDNHRSGLSMGILSNLMIGLAPLREQQRIVQSLREHMAAVEQARRAAQARLEAIDVLLAAFVRDVFPQPGQAIPEGWRLATLGELCRGSGQYGTSKKSNNEKNGMPVLGMYHIHNEQIRWENVSHVQLSADESVKYLLKGGDLLFNRTNSADLVGKTAVYDLEAEAVFASYLIRFQMRTDIADPYFVSAYINSHGGRAFIEQKMGRAIGQVNISASTMNKMPIPLPCICEQRRISTLLRQQMNNIDGARKAALDELLTIDALPGALLRRAFEGWS